MIDSKWLTAALILVASACIEEGDPGEDGLELDSTEQAFTSSWNYSWGDTKFSKADIGTATNRACFLSGVAGRLTTSTFPTGSSQGGAGVSINPSTNHWEIWVDPTLTGTLQVWARCMNTTTLTSEVTWRSNTGKAILAPVTAKRQCFFTRLKSGRDNSFAHGGFYSSLDQVYIANDGVNWYIDGSQSGLVWAAARCIDVTEDLGTTFNWANPGSSNTVAVRPATADVACLLTQVSGKINNLNDWEAGPHVKVNTTYNYYDFIARDGNGGRVRCVR